MVKWTTWTLVLAACIFNCTASASSDDAFTALIRERIEAFSAASSRGDQTGMNNLVDDEVLFSSGSGTVDRDPERDKSDAIATLLRQQTQALHNAHPLIDTAAIKRYVADDALFIDAEGNVSGKQDVSRTASVATAKDASAALAVTDWVLHYSDDVAVASFVGERTVNSGNQALSRKFLAVETWIRANSQWKLIASQTIPLYQDPPGVILSSDALQDYVGDYTGGPGLAVAISLDGSTLSVSSNGRKAVVYQAEGSDVFFTPGSPPGVPRSRIIFQRDNSRHVTGYVSSRGLEVTRSGSVTAPSIAADAQSGISSTVLPAANLVVRHFGDVAIATFIHERVTHYYGQVLHEKYRSTETWIKRGAEWKMLSLQSCELNRPLPPPRAAPNRP
jgi:ketosteroid isomerase-like protein